MLALSVKQPWAELLVSGQKTIEVRTWMPPRKLIGQRIIIHAGKRIAEDAPMEIRRLAYEASGAWQGQVGGIVGLATLANAFRFCEDTWEQLEQEHLNPVDWWEPGKTGFEFVEPVRLPLVRWRGELGFFEIPERVISAAQAAGGERKGWKTLLDDGPRS